MLLAMAEDSAPQTHFPDGETAFFPDAARTEANELAWSSDAGFDEPVPRRRWVWVLLAGAAVALVGTLIWAAVAFNGGESAPAAAVAAAPTTSRSAVQDDKVFLNLLTEHGVVISEGQRGALAVTGRKTCVTLDGGTTRALMVAELVRETGMSSRDAGVLLSVSAVVFCPRYIDVVGSP